MTPQPLASMILLEIPHILSRILGRTSVLLAWVLPYLAVSSTEPTKFTHYSYFVPTSTGQLIVT
jgi:hypothetical protein